MATERMPLESGNVLRIDFPNGEGVILRFNGRPEVAHVSPDGEVTDLSIPPLDKPVYHHCGICDSYHPLAFTGDCRDDTNRFTLDELDKRHGSLGWSESD